MNTRNKIAAAVMEAIKAGDHRSLEEMGVVRRENSNHGSPRYSVTIGMVRAIGLDEDEAARILGGRFGRMDWALYFMDWSDCRDFCKKVSDMIKENDGE